MLSKKIGFRSTKVRTLTGHIVTIPNGGLTGDAVENVSSRPSIRHMMNVSLPVKTPRDNLDRAVQIIRDILAEEGVRERIHPLINGDLLEPAGIFQQH